ncbi:MAG: DUF2207 domain-containing protein [Mariprofundaceae bacterium]|nr:DUF2207 domain-containing protein [Mariprofundaceae bacterium]
MGAFFLDGNWFASHQKLTEHYDVDIHVQEDGSLDVEERFDLDGGKQLFSFGMNIPAQLELDSKLYAIAASNIHIFMDDQAMNFIVHSSKEEHWIQVANTLVHSDSNPEAIQIKGKHQFVFQYHIDHGLIKKSDGTLRLYWPVTGMAYGAVVDHSSVDVTFPEFVKYEKSSFVDKPFSENEQSRPASVWKSNNTYHANIQTLKAFEQWGVNINLPATGFKLPKVTAIGVVETQADDGPKNMTDAVKRLLTYTGEPFHGWRDIPRAILALMPWLLLLVCIWRLYPLWINTRIKNSVTERTSYTPPDGLEAAEVGLLIDQEVNSSDIGAAILELEREGFLSIDGYVLRSIKDVDSSALPDYKRYLLEILFHNRDAIDFESTLSKQFREDLDTWERRLFSDLQNVKDKLTRLMEKKAYLIPDSIQAKSQFGRIWVWLAIAGFLLACAHLFYISEDHAFAIMVVSFSTSFFLLLFSTLFLNASPGRFIVKGLNLLFFVCVGAVQLIILQWMVPGVAGIPGALQAGLLPAILLGFFIHAIKKEFSDKTAKGQQALNETLGYKDFLQRVEVGQLTEDLSEYPKAYPYAVAFGLMDDWVVDIQSQCGITKSRHDSRSSDLSVHPGSNSGFD